MLFRGKHFFPRDGWYSWVKGNTHALLHSREHRFPGRADSTRLVKSVHCLQGRGRAKLEPYILLSYQNIQLIRSEQSTTKIIENLLKNDTNLLVECYCFLYLGTERVVIIQIVISTEESSLKYLMPQQKLFLQQTAASGK